MQWLDCTITISDKNDRVIMSMYKNLATNSYGSHSIRGKKCDHYHFSQNTRDSCYKLIGYPPDWNNGKGGYNGYSKGRFGGYQFPGQANNIFSAHNFVGHQLGDDEGQFVPSRSQESKDINSVVVAK